MAAQVERFTRRARAVLALAEEEARRFDRPEVGPEHLLLGLAREGEGVGGRALAGLDLSLSRLRAAVAAAAGFGAAGDRAGRGLGERAERVVALAGKEAADLGHRYVGTEHLLLGYLRQAGEAGDGVLDQVGVGAAQVREQVLRLVAEAELPPAGAPGLMARVKRGLGRPPLHGERMGSVRVNVPRDLAAALAASARQRRVSQSEIVRLALEQWLGRDASTAERTS